MAPTRRPARRASWSYPAQRSMARSPALSRSTQKRAICRRVCFTRAVPGRFEIGLPSSLPDDVAGEVDHLKVFVLPKVFDDAPGAMALPLTNFHQVVEGKLFWECFSASRCS